MSTGTETVNGSFSARELQAAAEALVTGRFAPGAPAAADAASRWPVAAHAASGLVSLVRVRAANAGAGASTVTLALADAADAAGVRARVLDGAAPAWSGLLAATATELGESGGWRRGRRGEHTVIDRVEDPVQAPVEVPPPPSFDEVDLTLLDAGWSMRELTTTSARGSWLAATPARVEVLVTRPHSLALSQAEAALVGLEEQLDAGRVLVVVVGAARWSDRGFAAAGRRLCRAHQEGAVLFAPPVPRKTLPGLGPDALPKQLMSPAQCLLERITTITGPLTASRT